MDKRSQAEAYLNRLPDEREIRQRLSRNLRERTLLRQLLKIAEQRRKVEEATSCND